MSDWHTVHSSLGRGRFRAQVWLQALCFSSLWCLRCLWDYNLLTLPVPPASRAPRKHRFRGARDEQLGQAGDPRLAFLGLRPMGYRVLCSVPDR